jgi:hypothetical protein
MAWQTQITINNRTGYAAQIKSGDAVVADVAADSSHDWTTTTQDQVITVVLKDGSNVEKLQGTISFGPDRGLYFDRGSMSGDAQDITLGASVNVGTLYTQSRNGGETVLPWSQFASGGQISASWIQDGH